MTENSGAIGERQPRQVGRRRDWLVIGAYLTFIAGVTAIWFGALVEAVGWLASRL